MLAERQKKLDRIIRCVGDLPALPATVTEVLNITEDPSVPMTQISAHIQDDPALTAKILRVSNSPYYGMRQYVGTLTLALVVLGVREVRNIVLGVSVFDALHGGKIDAMLLHEFWEHSVKVGGISKKIGNTLSLGLQGEDFISGLLHDIGKVLLLRQLGSGYANVLQASGGCSDALCALEVKTFGFDHADAAAALAAFWNLPQTLTDALWCHHAAPDRPIANAKDPKLAALVRIANAASREDLSDPNAPPAASCLDAEAWNVLGVNGTYGSPEARRDLLAGFVGEFARADETAS